jgi:hypothetical protein
LTADPDRDPATQINADPCGSGSATLPVTLQIKVRGFIGHTIPYDDYFYSITQVFQSPYKKHSTCSDESEGYPDLTDLGVKLHTLEQRMPWEVSS